jgi:hypothetical protein
LIADLSFLMCSRWHALSVLYSLATLLALIVSGTYARLIVLPPSLPPSFLPSFASPFFPGPS